MYGVVLDISTEGGQNIGYLEAKARDQCYASLFVCTMDSCHSLWHMHVTKPNAKFVICIYCCNLYQESTFGHWAPNRLVLGSFAPSTNVYINTRSNPHPVLKGLTEERVVRLPPYLIQIMSHISTEWDLDSVLI